MTGYRRTGHRRTGRGRTARSRWKAYAAAAGLGLALGVPVWFRVPWSPLRARFSRDVAAMQVRAAAAGPGGTFTEDDFAGLPPAVREFVARAGFPGTPRMNHMRIRFTDVAFSRGPATSPMRIDYTQYNSALEPERLALIESGMFSVPFEGYDYYAAGTGGMHAVLGKAVTLFDHRGSEMDQACLATYLAESLFLPASLLTGKITFEHVDAHRVAASVSHGGAHVSGEFRFTGDFEMAEFTTRDRAVARPDGTMEYVPWTARASGYAVRADGLRLPTRLQAVWEYPDAPLVYFDGAIGEIAYG